jgi:hypothetical protein
MIDDACGGETRLYKSQLPPEHITKSQDLDKLLAGKELASTKLTGHPFTTRK